eukprot:124915-Prymnesium_polylepis.1
MPSFLALRIYLSSKLSAHWLSAEHTTVSSPVQITRRRSGNGGGRPRFICTYLRIPTSGLQERLD